MPSKQTTTVVLTEQSQEVKDDLAPVFGLKNILSAGLVLFNKLNADDQKRIIAEANGYQIQDPAERAAMDARMVIKTYQSLSPKDFAVSLQFLSDEESQRVRRMLADFKPSSQYKKGKRRVGKIGGSASG